MNNLLPVTDRAAIGLSLLCSIHCLALPLVFALLPSLENLLGGDEVFHRWMLLAVIPTSLYALGAGFRRHRQYPVLLAGGLGLSLLILAAQLGHEALGESGETLLSLAGAAVMAGCHLWNRRLAHRPHAHYAGRSQLCAQGFPE